MASVIDQTSALNCRVAYCMMFQILVQCFGGLLLDWLWLFDLLCSCVDLLELIEVLE